MGKCPNAHCSKISAQINKICKDDGFKGTPVVYVTHEGAPCYCKCSCVAIDTLVAAPRGEWKRMGDFNVGDSVLALVDGTKWEEREVKFSDGSGEVEGNAVPYAIFLGLANGNGMIVTSDHPFLLHSGKLQVSCRLSLNDFLVDESLNPVGIATIGYGVYVGGIHNISTSTGPAGEGLSGHLINTAGVISGDYYAQLYLIEDEELNRPVIGMPDYFNHYGISESLHDAAALSAFDVDPRFVPHQRFSPPARAVGFLPNWMEQTVPENLRPLDDTLPLEIAEYLIDHFKKSYPDISYHIRWTDNTVNAYAWRQGGEKHVALLGGIIRHRSIGIEGLGLVIAHEIGHHYGGVPRYPNNAWASCEGQADYWGAMVAMREVWWGEKALEQIEVGAQQLYELFAYGLLMGLDESEAERRLADLAGCGHPPAQCRLDTYLATLALDPKPECAG